MCVAVPMEVVGRDGDTIVAEIDGVRREATLMILGDEVQVGIMCSFTPCSSSPSSTMRERWRPCK